jgi:hypothetical protein
LQEYDLASVPVTLSVAAIGASFTASVWTVKTSAVFVCVESAAAFFEQELSPAEPEPAKRIRNASAVIFFMES